MKVKIHRKTGLLVFFFQICLPCLAAQQSRALHERTDLVLSEKLGASLPAPHELWLDGTVTFLSDDQLALSLCHVYLDSQCPVLLILRIDDDGFHLLAVRNRPGPFVSLHPTLAGGVLTQASPQLGLPTEVFSAELIPKLQIPGLVELSPSGKTVAREGPNHSWTVSHICPPLVCLDDVRQVNGDLKAVSDDEIAILDHKMIRIETVQGKQMGGFKVQTDCELELEFADRERIYLRSCGRDRIVDLNGKELAPLMHPGDWGPEARGWSADGTRLLYERPIRKVPPLQKFGETVGAILAAMTQGMIGPDVAANGEAVHVFDTATGKACFNWTGVQHFAIGGVHPRAALSPSGKSVALVTEGELRIYRLPNTCSGAKSK